MVKAPVFGRLAKLNWPGWCVGIAVRNERSKLWSLDRIPPWQTFRLSHLSNLDLNEVSDKQSCQMNIWLVRILSRYLRHKKHSGVWMQFSQSCSSKLKQHLNASAAAGPQNTLTNKIVLLILKNNFVSFPFKGFSKDLLGSGCGAVGRAVPSYTRDLQFETSHWQFYLLSTVLKTLLKRQK